MFLGVRSTGILTSVLIQYFANTADRQDKTCDDADDHHMQVTPHEQESSRLMWFSSLLPGLSVLIL